MLDTRKASTDKSVGDSLYPMQRNVGRGSPLVSGESPLVTVNITRRYFVSVLFWSFLMVSKSILNLKHMVTKN